MKNAADFIVDLRRSPDLCAAVEAELSNVDLSDSESCIQGLVKVGAARDYSFTKEEYKEAAYQFSKSEAFGLLSRVNDDVVMGPWTTGGASCVSMCPTRSDVC